MPLSLEDFIIQEVAKGDEWRDWCEVRDAQPPDDRWVPPADRSKLHPSLRRDDLQGPTREHDRKQQLMGQFEVALRETLGQGGWKVTGRVRGRPPRVELEFVDVLHLVIDLRRGRIGDYQDVEISQTTVSHQHFLQQKIEALCKNVSSGDSLGKQAIEDILNGMYPDQFSIEHFRAAWKDAKIDEKWRRPGRRRGSA